MRASKQRALPSDLRRAQTQFLAWRRRRQPGSRIPEPLWQLAVRLVSSYGLSRTATALRLDFYRLKKQVAAASSQLESNGPAFVEVPAPAVLVGKQARVELDNGAGVSLRVHLVGYDAADLEALTRRFWNADGCCRSPRT
jgi:hypothetical protein